TRQVFFNDCPVPVENLLSERGNGFKIAVNILNIGRVKLGAGVLGGCRRVLSLSLQYANERKQFGVSIGTFGAIQAKLAEMAIQTFTSESLCYRAGQDIEDRIEALIAGGMEMNQAKLKGVEQFAIECAIAKIHGSEVLDYVVDQGVQVYGGMGYSADVPMEKAYRDARISRIYEGTNEINRMLMVGMLLKRAMKGEINIFEPAMAVSKELTSIPSFDTVDATEFFASEKEILDRLKKVFLMVSGKAAQTFMNKIEEEQEVMMNLADIMIEIYAAESVLLRAEKLVLVNGEESTKSQIAMARVYLSEAVDKINIAAKEAIGAFVTGDEQKVMLMGLKRFTKSDLLNTKKLRREIAEYMLEKGKYTFFI
ncbi:MAG TPA: acyl-CoA dehydrogenase family protein, partial [Cyclobacteriaceae bacterium]|nr:acyl-CoA dehydrogenase family protein [Cyclobacteriaceae bacterium]